MTQIVILLLACFIALGVGVAIIRTGYVGMFSKAESPLLYWIGAGLIALGFILSIAGLIMTLAR